MPVPRNWELKYCGIPWNDIFEGTTLSLKRLGESSRDSRGRGFTPRHSRDAGGDLYSNASWPEPDAEMLASAVVLFVLSWCHMHETKR